MFISALFMVAKTWKQLKHPLTDGWMKEMWYTYTMEYYSAIRKDEILAFTKTWIHLQNITLHKISQTEKVQNNMILFIYGHKTKSNKGTRRQINKNSQTQTTVWWLSEGMAGERALKGKWGQMQGDSRRFDFGGEHVIQYTGDVLQNCMLETYIILLANVTPI